MEEHDRETVTITNARFGRSVDLRHREIRYLVSMGIRTLCFIAAVVTSGPLRWCFIAAALFLPYFAVVLANNGSPRKSQEAETVRQEPIGEISESEHPGGPRA